MSLQARIPAFFHRSTQLAAALLTGVLMTTTAQTAQAADGVHNIILVHGAWADGSSWAKIIAPLQARGFNVVAVKNPLTSLADDAATTRRAIALMDGPVLLVGHSYGGAVITEAGSDPKVVGLVYVAAFAPDEGQAVGDLGKDVPPAPGGAELRPDAQGYLSMTTKGVEENFAQDLPIAERKVLAATQGPTNGACFGAKISSAAWHVKPTWYMISPELERRFAKTMNAKTLSLPSSHVPMLSHPVDVANFIADAAKSVVVK
jgi:pimeloyl-ACP methyl ester carboxylesterase